MDIEKRLVMLQNTYAASIAETVNTYEKMNALDSIVERKKERQSQSAPYLVQQLGIQEVEDVFKTLSEIYGCANWDVKKTDDGYIAKATSCKLCAMSKKMGGANPCHGWCIDPMFAMIKAINADAEFAVDSTLMSGDCCSLQVKACSKRFETEKTAVCEK